MRIYTIFGTKVGTLEVNWVLANWYVGGHIKSDNIEILHVRPLRFHRRQLFKFKPKKGGKFIKYGGTLSLGIKRGSLINHKKYGITYVGGSWVKDRISIHRLRDGCRVSEHAKLTDCKILCYSSWVAINGS